MKIPLRDKIEFCYLHKRELAKIPSFDTWHFRILELPEYKRKLVRLIAKIARKDLGYSDNTADVDIIWLLFNVRDKILKL